MILVSPELDKFIINSDWEIKPFDLKLINNLKRNYPYQQIIFWVYEYYASYVDEVEGDILDEIDYFKLLDRYYRYGITFEDEDLYPKKRILYEKENFDEFEFGVKFENGVILLELLYVYEESCKSLFLLDNSYNLKQLLFNDVKTINLKDLDKGPITLSEVEKWKIKVVNQQSDRKTKLQLLDPNIYHSLITFVVFLKFNRPCNKIDYELSYDGISKVNKKFNNYKDKYKHTKIYEDKIFNKISGFLNKNILIK